MSGRARVGTLTNIGHVDTVHVAPVHAPEALFQLPADISDFVGREELETELLAHVDSVSRSERNVGVRLALFGPAGVGKSALAVRIAHAIAAKFPEAQLYVDLGAGAGAPVAPADALSGFLRALGVEGPYPDSLDERSAAFRARLAGKRVLILLDNAGTVDQIRALLPGASTSAVVVTSRRSLGGLEGVFSRSVETLRADEGVMLLSELVGPGRIEAERQAAGEIVRHCGELPLAVRVAGGRLRNLPGRNLGWLAGKLANERTRLDELELDDRAVRASLTVSYEELSPEEARMFCLLAALPGPDFSPALVAGSAMMDEQSAERLLDRLVEAQLLNVVRGERFQFHDLVLLYASECLDSEPTITGEDVERQSAEWLLDHATAATRALDSEPPNRRAALAWFEAERESLVAAVEAAHEGRNWEAAIAITLCLSDFFSLRGYWDEWVRTSELALSSSRQAEDSRAEIAALNNLANVYLVQARWTDAIAINEQALAIASDLGDRHAEASTLNNLGIVYRRLTKWDEAIIHFERALVIRKEQADRHGEGQTLTNIGNVFLQQERWDEAIENYQQALPICREFGDRHGEGQTLNNLAIVYTRQERWDEAIANYEQDLAICRELGDRHGEGRTLSNVAGLYTRQERWDEAIANYEQDLAICREFGDRHGEGQTLYNLGNVHLQQERWREAIAHYEHSLAIYREFGDGPGEIRALHNLELARGSLSAE